MYMDVIPNVRYDIINGPFLLHLALLVNVYFAPCVGVIVSYFGASWGPLNVLRKR